MKELNQIDTKKSISKFSTAHKGFVHQSEDEKLLKDVLRPNLEKLQLFTKMLRRNTALKKGIIVNKSSV